MSARSVLAAEVSADLIARCTDPSPLDREYAGAIADLAVETLTFARKAAGDATIGNADALLIQRGTDRLVRALHRFGPSRAVDSLAEAMVGEAIGIADALLAAIPSEGSA